MIQIKLNGETREVPENLNLAEFLRQLHLNARQVAVAKNWEVIVRGDLEFTAMEDGDDIEIFHAVGGG